ncbi:FAD-binding domain-containing protein [Thozetella sp. PMI_491]|nr:FAD-binding domain-containing protein [Thozetella sp. PMI_491]
MPSTVWSVSRSRTIVAIIALTAFLCSGARPGPLCKPIPGDDAWPVEQDWNRLNRTINGRLIATRPLPSVCHVPSFDNTSCSSLRSRWLQPEPYVTSPAEFMYPVLLNESCSPFSSPSTSCTLGNYASFSINVTSAKDVRASIAFARENNVRLVIRNTGHDLLGKSTGKGGLSLWMHHLDSVEIQSYESMHYTGPALKMGAGVIGANAISAAHEHGYRLITGTCPSIGIAGGYTMGGGHGMLSGKYGLSADNVLEWEVITANGRHLTATPTENSDLYFALSGGGGGTYGVVVSMTVRLYPEGPVAGGFLTFNASSAGADAFWEAVQLFHSVLPAIVDTGATATYVIANGVFRLLDVFAVDRTASQMTVLLAPFLAGLRDRAIPYIWLPRSADSYYDHYVSTFGPLPWGVLPVSQILTSRLIPRTAFAGRPDLVNAVFRNTVQNGEFYFGCFAVNASTPGGPTDPPRPLNAILPAWREALAHCMVLGNWNWTIPYQQMAERETVLVDQITPELVRLTPGSGTYLNEANSRQIGWEQEFYGENWKVLSKTKTKYDPEGLFYAPTAIGSEKWEHDPDGRICRTG